MTPKEYSYTSLHSAIKASSDTKTRKKVIVAAILGNFLEWYDFSLYGLFATILAEQFFPSTNKLLALLAIFSVLAIGYLMRPLGGIFFSHISDKFGRKKALSATLLIMAFSTTCIGLLPTYHHVGVLAGLLLILLRLLQGFAVGGEYSSSMVYLIEHAPNHRKCLYGSFVLFGSYLGLLMGTMVGFLVEHVSANTPMITWSWRIPFILGSVIGLIGLYIRRYMPETPDFNELKKEKTIPQHPLYYIFKHYPSTLLKAIGVMLLPAIGSYLTFVYFPSYLTLYANINLETAFAINIGAIIVMLISIPIIGLLADYFGAKFFIIISAVSFILFSYFLYQTILTHSLWQIIAAQSLFAIMVCLSESITPAFLASLFPTEIRCTGLAIPINIANGFFGGTSPLLITFLINLTHQNLIPALYLISVGLITLLVTLSIRRLPTPKNNEVKYAKKAIIFANKC